MCCFSTRYEALLNQVAGLQREVAKQNADTKALRDENEVSFPAFFQRSEPSSAHDYWIICVAVLYLVSAWW